MSTAMTTTDTVARPVHWVRPLFDVYESDADWLLVADLPGVTADELHVTVEKRELTIQARSGETTGFRRAFTLPDGAEDVDARLVDGTLEVRIARPAASVARRIDVRTA